MVDLGFTIEEVGGIKDYNRRVQKAGDTDTTEEIFETTAGKAFLIVGPKTIEVRCDAKLGNLLQEKYESVMQSRYFGKGGVEIVPSGQLETNEIKDLIRLSYNLS